MSNELVLVTGATGFLAPHVIKILLKNGYRVRGSVRNLKDEKKIQPLKELGDQLELVQADLMEPESWINAVHGCKYVIHMASPFPLKETLHPDQVIKPAVQGTLNVLRACSRAGSVKRVVLTSSIAAIMGDMTKQGVYDEEDWTNVNSNITSYLKSKTLAEKAAWDFVKDTKAFELTVVNPGLVLGPLLHNSRSTSVEIVRKMLTNEIPMIPKLHLPVVDVRDVALGHLKAMTMPEANGKRHLLVNRTVWLKDLADILDKEFRPQGYIIPLREAPYLLLKFKSFFDKSLNSLIEDYGKEVKLDAKRMTKVLEINPIDLNYTVLDMAYSLIDRGLVKRTAQYKSKL
jgi:nucleoside-diphosphate-sugar epimerase